MERRLCVALAITALALGLAAGAFAGTDTKHASDAADDWPQFRGNHRDGISPATGLLDTWPEDGPKELWRQPIGEGYSGTSIAGGRIFTMYAEMSIEEASGEANADAPGEQPAEGEQKEPAKTEFAAAFDATSGKEVWRFATGQRIVTQFGNGPRSTPTVDGDTVYVLGAHGELAALSTTDGKVHWEMTLADTFGSKQPYWGFSTSTLIEGDMLLVESNGTEGKAYAALDKASGKVLWTTGDTSPNGSYNSPMAITMGDKRQFVYIGKEILRAVDTDGKELWSHPWPEGESHAMPIYIPPDKFFASGTEDIGAALIQVTSDGGGMKVEEVWKNRLMRNHFSSSIVHDGHVYGFDNATLKCISLETGEQRWAKRGFGKGSLIYADGHLIVLSDRGTLIQVEATATGYVEKGRVQALEGTCWTAPALADGKLYLRSQTEMVSYDLKAKE